MLKGQSVLLPLALMVVSCAFPVERSRAQEAAPGNEMHLVIIVTRTSEEAQAVLKALNAGMDFGVIAKEHSIDPSADNGGYLGELNPANLPPAERDALQKMHGEKFTGIVPVNSGFAILTILPGPPKVQNLNADQMKRLASSGVIRQSISVAGLVESDAAFRQYPKPDGWELDSREQCNLRNESHAAAVARLEKFLSDAEGQTENKPAIGDIMHAYQALAQLHAYTGDLEASIKEWTKALEISKSEVPAGVPYLEEALGISYFQLAEIENEAFRYPGDNEIFPPPEQIKPYEKQENSRMAIKYFQDILETFPEDLQVKWLLNVTYESVGEYPAGVPAKYLMPASLFGTKENIGRFIDVAPAAGLNVVGSAGGVLVDDFENNGQLDVITSSEALCDPLHYFHNNGDGTFTDRTAQAGLSDQLGGLNIIEGDYNNDGCMDFLVLRGGW